MAATATLKQVNRAIAKAGLPLELERGEGYHYFICDDPTRNIYETVAVYVTHTNTCTVAEWVGLAAAAYAAAEPGATPWNF